jgi:NTE family protein
MQDAMRKVGIFLLLLLLLSSQSFGQRKKVGLVLSGGGAKGVAHIGVLKVLEEAGIPIDYIAGTSMGAIVGGLYAVGYSAKELDSLVRVQNWSYLLGDKVNHDELSFYGKELTEKYLLSFSFSRDQKLAIPAGLVAGNNIYNLFCDLTLGYHDSISFRSLPIPFACVAADMVSGNDYVMDRGMLALAMRASMAIPGVFAPVVADSMVLVDGGVSNNFPVDVAEEMGADVTIGVDLSTGLKDMNGLESLMGLVDQLTSFMGMRNYQKNKEAVDLYMNPELKGYSAASFTPEAIDTMILRGERVARANWDKIIALKKSIGLAEDEDESPHLKPKFSENDTLMVGKIVVVGMQNKNEDWWKRQLRIREYSSMTLGDLQRSLSFLYGTGAFTKVNYAINGPEPYTLTLFLQEKPVGSLNFGFCFDSEEMASILLNTTFVHSALRGSRISLTGRLSKNPYVQVDYSFGSTFLRKLGASYSYRYNDINLYNRGKRVDNVTFGFHRVELNYSDIYLKNFKFLLALRYEHVAVKSLLYDADYLLSYAPYNRFFSYYASTQYETFDQRYYPSKGISFKAEYSLYTDNMLTFDGTAPFSALSMDFQSVVRLTNRMCLLPAFYGRVLMGQPIATPYLNCMGGEVAGRYLNQQLPFYGIHKMELFENSLVVLRLAARQRLWRKHYVTLVGNYAKHANTFWDILKGENIWGGALIYSYDSLVGPIGVTLDASNRNRKLGAYFTLGYYF